MSHRPLQLRAIPGDLVRYLISVGCFSFKGLTVCRRVVLLKVCLDWVLLVRWNLVAQTYLVAVVTMTAVT